MKIEKPDSDVRESMERQSPGIAESIIFSGMRMDFDRILGSVSGEMAKSMSSLNSNLSLEKKYRRVNEGVMEKHLVSIYTSIVQNVSQSPAEQNFRFNIEFSDGKMIDVKSEYKGNSWSFALAVDDRSLKKKLANSKRALANVLKKTLGAQVNVDVF